MPGSCGAARATTWSSTPSASRPTSSGSATGCGTNATSRPTSEPPPERETRVLPPAERRAGTVVPGRQHHLPGLRAVELELGPGGAGVLLAPVLRAPARPELRQPRGPPGDVRCPRPVARDGRGRRAARRDPVPVRAGGDELREPPR